MFAWHSDAFANDHAARITSTKHIEETVFHNAKFSVHLVHLCLNLVMHFFFWKMPSDALSALERGQGNDTGGHGSLGLAKEAAESSTIAPSTSEETSQLTRGTVSYHQ